MSHIRRCCIICMALAGLGWPLVFTGDAVAQSDRDRAIAFIAKAYPNSEKPPEQIYEEGRAREAAIRFARRFKHLDMVALVGALEEDSIRVVRASQSDAVTVTLVSAETALDTAKATALDTAKVSSTASREAGFAPTDTSSAAASAGALPGAFPAPAGVEGEIVHLVFRPRKAVTTAAQDLTEAGRRALRAALIEAFRAVPPDVRIGIHPKRVAVAGDAATVEASWRFEVLGAPNAISRPYLSRPALPLAFQMRKVGDDWLVADLKGILKEIAGQL